MSEWISAEECTPWGDDLVIAAAKYKKDWIFVLAWHGDEQWSGGWHILMPQENNFRLYEWKEESEVACIARVEYWMPLPELPEEGE